MSGRKQAVMYGGGNIGRGFIGALFSQSGYDVTFLDVADKVIVPLREKHCYPVRIVSSEGFEDLLIDHVDAVNGNDAAAAAEIIASCDILATAVGVNILKYIVPNLKAGLKLRFARTDEPLNIIICENLMDANRVLEGMLKAGEDEAFCRLVDERVGFVEASIGRMVPVQTPEMQDGEPLRVCVERYGYLPVDGDAFKGGIPEIRNMIPFSPFDFYLKRKLYVHNMGHAVCAYLGLYRGAEYIYESIADPWTALVTENAMLESAQALSARYGVPLGEILRHIEDLLHRFTNRALRDTCARVGGDQKRKLAPTDRLIGSASLCLEEKICPAFIAVGAAGAVFEYQKETGREQTDAAALETLRELSGLSPDAPLAGMILEAYRLYRTGAEPREMYEMAEARRHQSLTDVV